MYQKTGDQEVTYTQDEFIILETLLDARDRFVSDNFLAELLGSSLPTIREKLENLRRQNFNIEAIHKRGYRLKEQPETLHAALIRYYLKKTAIDIEVLHFPLIDSTNSEAARQHAAGRKSPFAITSSCQNKGRGRLGREWHSASAKNLYLSVLFEPTIPPPKLQCFTLWVGIYICRIIQQLIPNAPLKIKWPNDLQCDGRKFAGMLTEAKIDSGGPCSIIFGVGINVNSNPLDYPDELRSSATSLYAISGKEISLNLLTVYVLQAITQAYETCLYNETRESLVEAWAPLDALSGKTVTACYSNTELSGVANGIDASGALLLVQADRTLNIRAGEVTLKK